MLTPVRSSGDPQAGVQPMLGGDAQCPQLQPIGAPPGWQQVAFHPNQPGNFAHVDDCVNGAGAWYPAL